MLRTPEGVKREHIAHLDWCLEHLKYKDGKKDEELYQYIYKYIYFTARAMEEMEPYQANEYYLKRINDRISNILLDFGIRI